MNRTSRFCFSLSQILMVLVIACSPVIGRAATTVATPTFSLAAGSYTGTQSVTIADATSGATCYYTLTAGTTGTTPTTSSIKYTSAISVTASSVLEALCTFSGDTNSAVASAKYTITAPVVATPTFSPVAGSYTGAQSVTLSDATSGATIYYTVTAGTTGTAPTSGSTKYTGAFTVSATSVVEAIAELSGDTNSAVASAAYTITVPTPTFSLAAGSYTGTQSVTIADATSGATCYYTLTAGTTGTTPTTSSIKYTSAISVTASSVLEALCTYSGDTNSAVASAKYTITAPVVATPTFSPVAGSYTGAQSVTLSDATSGATIYYTVTAGTTGTAPTSGSTKYTGAFTVSATSVVEAIAELSGDTNSAVASAAYTFTAPMPVFSLVGGSYFGSQTLTITDSNSSATIYYTTNGTTPTTSSTKYTGAITVGSTETLQAIAVITGYTNSAIASATYTITTTPGTLSIFLSPPGVQSSTVSGVLTETFDALTASSTPYTTPYVSVAGIGTYTGSSAAPYAITAPNEYGGAIDSTSSTPTNYFAVGTESDSENPVTLALTQPVSYFGFWWSAGDAYNRVALYSGNSLYGTFTTANLLSFLNNGLGTITASNGTSYNTSSYFGNPNLAAGSNDSSEPFAYVSFAITGATITQIEFYNDSTSTGFESDNHSVIFNGNTVTIPTTFVPVETLTLGSQVATPVFTPSYSVLPMTVTISSTTPGASINYTTNGTAPTTTTGTVCSNPCTVSVGATETIEAIAYETGMTNSAVASMKYTIPTLSVASSSNPSTYGGSVTFTATISSGPTGTVTFYDSGTAIGTGTISGTTATFSTALLAVGTHTISAGWVGNASYGSVLSSAITQTVTQAPQTITFPTIPPQTVGTPLTLAATATSSLAVTFTSATQSICTVTGTTATFLATGTCTIDANQAGNGNYAAAAQVAQSFSVSGEAQTITFPTIPPQTVGTPLMLAATATSSLAVTFTSATQSICTVTGTTATFLATGTCTIDANQPGNSIYAAAPQVAQSFGVSPPPCASSIYGYQRVITIDHTKVPNTDQANFPFLFSTTDPTFATTANGGHMTSPNGYDIIFTSDPAGQNILNYEMEEYDPVLGQVVTWVRIPTLSHTTDTVIYMFYGNSNMTTSQQNPAGVWDSNYQAVYHLANVRTGIAADSTANGNNGTLNSVSTATGEIDGAVGFNGTSSYIQIPEQDFQSFFPTNDAVFSESFEVWFKTASTGVILSVDDGTEPNNVPDSYVPALYIDNNGMLRASFYWHGSQYEQIVTSEAFNDNKWHYAVDTYNGLNNNNNGSETGTETLFVDGIVEGTQTVPDYSWSSGTRLGVFLGTGWTGVWPSMNGSWYYFNGALDDIKLSGISRSSDWIAAEYNNQSSPSSFYKLTTENAVEVVPAVVNLYAGQSQQFTAMGVCSAVAWTMPLGSKGVLSASGLYLAPANITTLQTVTVTATNQSSGIVIGSGIVTLLPPPTLTLTATFQPPYETGSSQGFVATLKDATGTPKSGATVTFNVAGANSSTGSIITDSNGVASFAYIGSNSGSDTVQATAAINGQQLMSNSVSATWTSLPSANAEGSVTLQTGVNLGLTGLCGAFTDSNGVVIEPIAIGAAPRVFAVPAGATQLQLGVDDDRYGDNTGSGFLVEVNGVLTTVPPPTMPWNWVAGGLNTNYKFGILDGTSPIIALTNLMQGEEVSINYQSGTVLAGIGFPFVAVDADGFQQWITGERTGSTGTYFPTLYGSSANYPIGQPIPITAVVTNGSGTPLANVPVMFDITGANAREQETTTDSTGTAVLSYVGINAGTDIVVARAFPSGAASLVSGQNTVTWVDFSSRPPAGALTLTPGTVQPLPAGGQQVFTVYATDAAGNIAANVNLEMAISGVDTLALFATTDSTGHASFVYQDVNPGVASVIVSGFIDSVIAYSQTVTVPWTLSPSTEPTIGCNNTIAMSGSIAALPTVALPNALQMNGTITDSSLSAGSTPPNVVWSQISGPGSVTFTNSQQAVTATNFTEAGTATFTLAGSYVLQMSASDSEGNCTSGQITVNVNPVPDAPQGWIGSPLNGSTVSGVVPITLASGVTLQPGGSLTYYPANNPSNTIPLTITAETGTISYLDTTTLANGSYWIHLEATNANGELEYSLVLVTVSGNYKPGRVTATVTDLVVPATGLAINIQRTYDSLNASSSGDFGYGWNLGINVNLTVDPKGDVTFTLGGQRKTFYFTPQQEGYSPLLGGYIFPWYWVVYTPEAGLHGTLMDSASGCADGFDFLLANGFCQDGSRFNPPGYIYTDPNGTAYTISAAGSLQSIVDRSGNGLTITASGITSTTGLNVPFVRDAQNRITQITDPQGNIYSYGYDANGNLATVTYPATPGAATCANASATNTSQYNYHTELAFPYNHYYAGGTDGRCNPLPVTAYYDSTTDGGNSALDGRLLSVTDAFNNTTSYAYNLSTTSTINGVSVPNTGVTTITYPQDSADGNGAVATSIMVYDSFGDLLTSTDPNGNTTTNAYDANHNLISVTDPLGNTSTYTYDANGNKTSSSYPATPTAANPTPNTTSTTVYNQYSEPISTTDELGNTRTFNYDANYNPQSVTDSIGTLASFSFNPNQTLAAGAIGFDITANPSMASQFTYDADGNMISRTDALGRTTSYSFNPLGQKISQVTPTPTSPTGSSASTTTYTYDPFGNLTQTAAPLNRTTYSTYDANGNKLSDTDARGNVTTYIYDALNRLVETDYPSNPSTPATKATKSYDFRNNVIDAVDQAGNDTHYTYDPAGRLTSVTHGYNSTTTTPTTTYYLYDKANRKTSETDAYGTPNAVTTNYNYDNDGRLTAISGPAGNFTYAYDDAGNRTSQTDGRGNTTQFHYDARKRLIETDYPATAEYPEGTSVKNTYDGPGNLASVTDQAGAVVQYTYDAANQLASVIQLNHPNPSANTNTYAYDPLGNLASLTDENQHTTANTFDQFGEPVMKVLPDLTLKETRIYDNAGNLSQLTHFNGAVTTYTYDALNRLLSRATPGEPTVSFTYTPTGKYATSTAADGTVHYTYNALDQLTSKATPEGTLSYTYLPSGKVETIVSSNPNGISVAYAYDDLNRLSTLTDNRLQGNQTTTYTYDPASNVATVHAPNGLSSTFTYDALNRLTAMNAGAATYSYQLGATGNRTGSTEGNGRSLAWNYDGIYRLTNETISDDPAGNNGSASYNLDPVGNRSSMTSTLPGINSGSWGYNADDEQISSESYDANGNVTQEANGNSHTYDSQNHMLSMTNGSTVINMTYDAFGNRVAKTVNGVTTQYLVEDDVNPTGLPQVVEELSGPIGAGVVTRTYTYGLQRINQNLSPVVTGNSTWTPSFYVYDGAGSVRQLTNSAGVVTDEYEYDAYGNSFTKTGSTPNNYLYRGEQYDADLGLYYLRARYYNPNTGRFMGTDPWRGNQYDPKTLHKYLYAGGDPVNWVDPSGREAMLEAALIQGALSLPSAVVLPPIARWVNCVLKTTAATLQDSIAPNGFSLISLMPNLSKCSASASWGVFGYGGMEGDAGLGGGFIGGIGEYDSNTGASYSGLTEGWIGGERPTAWRRIYIRQS